MTSPMNDHPAGVEEALKPCPGCNGPVYWSAEDQNFYCAAHKLGCGTDYYVANRKRCAQYPATANEALATRPHPIEAQGSETKVVDARSGQRVPGPHTSEMVESLEMHPTTRSLVNTFMLELACKLARAEEKYGYTDGWAIEDWEDECRRQLYAHAEKGDPLDVAAYAAFMWRRGWSTALTRACPTCDGRGEIGGFQRGGDNEGSWESEPCPECALTRPDPSLGGEPELHLALADLLSSIERTEHGGGRRTYRLKPFAPRAYARAEQALAAEPSPPSLGMEGVRGLHDLTDEDMQRASIDWSIAEVDLGLGDKDWACMEHVLKMFIRHRRAGGNPNPAGAE